jgi:DNA polymerase V
MKLSIDKCKLKEKASSHIKKSLMAQGEALLPLLYAPISCGTFGINDELIENYQSLDEHFIKNKTSTFLFQAGGDSMEPTIIKGDILLIDRSIEHYHRRICVLCYEGQLICKRVFKTVDGVILRSDNPKYQDIVVTESNSIEVWGVVRSRHGETP